MPLVHTAYRVRDIDAPSPARCFEGISSATSAPAARTAVPTQRAGTSPSTNACGEV